MPCNPTMTAQHSIVIVIVNSRFLERPQKRSHGNQLIHRRFIKTKSIGRGQDPDYHHPHTERMALYRLVLMFDLKKTGFKNVQGKVADGYYGWQEHAPFDAIVVTAAAEYIPPPLIKQLKEGGKMVIPVGSSFMTQMLMLVEKKGNKAKTRSLLPVVFVPLTRKK